MKIRLALAISFLALVFFTASPVTANFYIPDIDGTPANPYPDVWHFNWINANHYGYTGSFVFENSGTPGGGPSDYLKYTVDFTYYAPDNWNNANGITDLNGVSYETAGHIPSNGQWGKYTYTGDPGTTQVTSLDSGTNFNDVYSYFYTITVDPASEVKLFTFELDYQPIASPLSDFGYADTPPVTLSMADASNQLQVLFGSVGNFGLGGGDGPLTIYQTSQYWYGFNNYSADSTGGASGTSGKLPSPNPEAPTVALFAMGLLGVLGFRYYRKSGNLAA